MSIAKRAESYVRRTVKLSDDAPLGAIGVLFGLNFVDEFDRVAFATLTPEIRDSFGLSDTGIASVTILTGLFLLFAGVPIGATADRANRIRLATIAALLWGAMSVLTGIVPTLALLVVVRFFSGLGRGFNEVVHPSLLTDLYRPADQPAVFALHKLANPASAISALVAGGIGVTLGWRWAFVLLALPTIPLLFAVRRIPEPPRGRFVKMVDPPEGEAAVADAGATVAVTPPESVREAIRMLTRVRTLRRLWAAAAVVGMAAVPAAVFMSLFFEDVYGFGALGRGVAQVVLGIGGAAGLLLAGRFAPRGSNENGTGSSVADAPAAELAVHTARWLAVAALGLLLVALSPVAPLAVASLALVGLGTGGQQPVLLVLVGRVTPPSSRSLAFGLTALALGFGAILSLALFGVGESSGYRTALAIAGLFGLGAAALVHSARKLVDRDLADIEAASSSSVTT